MIIARTESVTERKTTTDLYLTLYKTHSSVSFVSVLVRGSRLRSGASWPARAVSVVQSTTEQPSARSADRSDRNANNTGERTFREKRGIG